MWNRLITPESARDMTGEPQSLFKTGPRPRAEKAQSALHSPRIHTKHSACTESESDSQRCDIKTNCQERFTRVKARDSATYTLVRIFYSLLVLL